MKPKSMRDIKELLTKDNKPKSNLTADEERLVDLLIFHKTGKRLLKFKKKKNQESTIPTISKQRSSVYEKAAPVTMRPEIPYDSTPIVNGEPT